MTGEHVKKKYKKSPRCDKVIKKQGGKGRCGRASACTRVHVCARACEHVHARVSELTFNAEPDFLQPPLLQHLLGYSSVLYVAAEPVQTCAADDCNTGSQTNHR